MPTKLSTPESFWYYFINIITLGGLYFVKVAVKKAICEHYTDILTRQALAAQQIPVETDQHTERL